MSNYDRFAELRGYFKSLKTTFSKQQEIKAERESQARKTLTRFKDALLDSGFDKCEFEYIPTNAGTEFTFSGEEVGSYHILVRTDGDSVIVNALTPQSVENAVQTVLGLCISRISVARNPNEVIRLT